MKILTVLGTRPEIIRLSRIISKLDQVSNHIVVNTRQNYDDKLNDIFFEEMRVRKPDHILDVKGKFGDQVGNILSGLEELLLKEKPDKFMVLGDTNSALSAIIAKRFGIPVYHLEAGNRCYDDRVPEEVNRRIIDHCSDVLIPYTENSKQNLLQEGIEHQRVFVSGNPILEVLNFYESDIEKSTILNKLNLEKHQYMLVTLHRAENVDIEERLINFSSAFLQISKKYKLPIVVSTHPHTRIRMKEYGIKEGDGQVRYLPPFGMFDFVNLEKNAAAVLSDSGTVQEECCIMKIPNVTLRDVTERPETIECGSNILSGGEVENILRCVDIAMSTKPNWTPPEEYLNRYVSDTILRLLNGYRHSI
jgi:UDP-N-acetylglucosamine 2-epimerase (non-hydrolysing)